jgi:hypothetical protein
MFSEDDRCSEFGCLYDPKNDRKDICQVCQIYLDTCKNFGPFSSDECHNRLCTNKGSGVYDFCSEAAGLCGRGSFCAPPPPEKNQTCIVQHPPPYYNSTCMYSAKGRCTDHGCIEDRGRCSLCDDWTGLCNMAESVNPYYTCKRKICKEDTEVRDVCGEESECGKASCSGKWKRDLGE